MGERRGYIDARVTAAHTERLRGLRWLGAKLRRRPTKYKVIDGLKIRGVDWP